jgi:hypothetical protein
VRIAQTIWTGARLLTLIALGTVLTGCGVFGSFDNPDISRGSRIGLRPDDAQINVRRTDTCEELKEYVKYAVNLKEAYRTRATQNRSWLYIAGITGLGIAAASGGLAAAGAAAAGTLGLLAISGGFTTGVFATIANDELASVYTVTANDIGTALTNTQARIVRCTRSQEECGAEVAYLSNRVTSARNTLETARTTSAAGALARAGAAKKLLDEEIAKILAQIEADRKAKEAAEKKAEAAVAEADAKKARKEADVAAEKAAPNDQAAKAKADQLAKDATAAEQKAANAKKAADDAEAKAKADADALAAATAPVTPSCLAPTGRVPGKILSFTPDTVKVDQGKARSVVAEIQDVDLRDISNTDLSIDIGGKIVPIEEKVQKGLGSPHSWTIRFVPPDKRPKDDEFEYTPSLLHAKEPLATAQTKIKYPTPQ